MITRRALGTASEDREECQADAGPGARDALLKKPTAAESVSPASAPRRKISDTRRTAGSVRATSPPRGAFAASCRVHALGLGAWHLRSILQARSWDRSDTYHLLINQRTGVWGG